MQHLRQPKTVSALWEELNLRTEDSQFSTSRMSYDGFVLALDMLFLIGTIEMENGILSRNES